MRKYTIEQLTTLLTAAEAMYQSAATCYEARALLDAAHKLRDRIAMARTLATVGL